MANRIGIAVKGIVAYDGMALLVQRSHEDHFRPGTWEFPGGKLEFGEEPEDGILREIWEETGLHVTVDTLLYADTFLKDDMLQVVTLVYACTAPSLRVVLSGEHDAHLWASRAALDALLDDATRTSLRRINVLLPIH